MAESVRTSLLRKASMNKTLAARVAVAVRAVPTPTLLTAQQRADLAAVIRLVRDAGEKKELPFAAKWRELDEAAKKLNEIGIAPPAGFTEWTAEAVNKAKKTKSALDVGTPQITTLPKFSPMQLKAEIDRLAGIHQQLLTLEAQYKTALDSMGKLEKEEKKGIDKLKIAAKELNQKGDFVIETQKALLKWTAYYQDKVPGIEQMRASPDDLDLKEGEKAGDLINKIKEEMGAKVASKVADIIEATKLDLTHVTLAIKGIEIVSKTASIHEDIVKRAGVLDALVGIKTWLKGEVSALTSRLLGFAGTLDQWVKGFVERTKMVEKAKTEVTETLDAWMKDLDKFQME